MTQSLAPGGTDTAAIVAPPADFLDGFISEEEYAARRGVSLRTCQRDRQLRQSPPSSCSAGVSITASRPCVNGCSPVNRRLTASRAPRAPGGADDCARHARARPDDRCR